MAVLISTVTFENVCRVHTKPQVIIKMCKFNMFITGTIKANDTLKHQPTVWPVP